MAENEVLNVNADRFLAWMMSTEEGQQVAAVLEEKGIATRGRPEGGKGVVASTDKGEKQPNPILDAFLQKAYSGGSHTAPEMRLTLYCLAVALRAKDILETGYDAGATTEVLAWTGARVVGIDDLSEYSSMDSIARDRLAPYDNVELVQSEALKYLENAPDASFDLIFVDDNHHIGHVTREAQEVRRILRPGGVAVFHDTVVHGIWKGIEHVFPDWQRVNLPAVSPIAKDDYGMGIVRKPER